MDLSHLPLVKAEFLDHSRSTLEHAGPCKIEVTGRLLQNHKDFIVIAVWSGDEALSAEDVDVYTVVKHRALKITKLSERKRRKKK